MGYDVTIERLALDALIDIQGDAEAVSGWCGDALPGLPSTPNTSSTNGVVRVYWVAPDRWLLRAHLDFEQELLAITRPNDAPLDISVVMVSDTLQFFSIVGPDADDIISVASPIDHHHSTFAVGSVTYTDIFGIKGLLIRSGDGFEIAVERSFGDMIEELLTRTRL